MARPRASVPRRGRALIAFDCGRRMAEWDTPIVVDLVNRGDDLTQYMTDAEQEAFARGGAASWWRHWWGGFRHNPKG